MLENVVSLEKRVEDVKGTYALAPKLKKNWSSAKHAMNAGVLNV